MPFLNDDEVLAFNVKIDELEDKRSKLDELNNDYIEKLKKKANQLRTSIIVAAVLLLCFLGSVFTMFFTHKSDKEILLAASKIKAKEKPIVKKKKVATKKVVKKVIPKKKVIKKKVVKKPAIVSEKKTGPFYAVQIGAYKKYNTEFTLDVKKLPMESLNRYVIGGFPEKEKAEDLKEFLRKVDFKDAFIVEIP